PAVGVRVRGHGDPRSAAARGRERAAARGPRAPLSAPLQEPHCYELYRTVNSAMTHPAPNPRGALSVAAVLCWSALLGCSHGDAGGGAPPAAAFPPSPVVV